MISSFVMTTETEFIVFIKATAQVGLSCNKEMKDIV